MHVTAMYRLQESISSYLSLIHIYVPAAAISAYAESRSSTPVCTTSCKPLQQTLTAPPSPLFSSAAVVLHKDILPQLIGERLDDPLKPPIYKDFLPVLAPAAVDVQASMLLPAPPHHRSQTAVPSGHRIASKANFHVAAVKSARVLPE